MTALKRRAVAVLVAVAVAIVPVHADEPMHVVAAAKIEPDAGPAAETEQCGVILEVGDRVPLAAIELTRSQLFTLAQLQATKLKPVNKKAIIIAAVVIAAAIVIAIRIAIKKDGGILVSVSRPESSEPFEQVLALASAETTALAVDHCDL